jgi:hypothetical protein
MIFSRSPPGWEHINRMDDYFWRQSPKVDGGQCWPLGSSKRLGVGLFPYSVTTPVPAVLTHCLRISWMKETARRGSSRHKKCRASSVGELDIPVPQLRYNIFHIPFRLGREVAHRGLKSCRIMGSFKSSSNLKAPPRRPRRKSSLSLVGHSQIAINGRKHCLLPIRESAFDFFKQVHDVCDL